MKNTDKVMSLETVSEILGLPIKKSAYSEDKITFETHSHSIEIQIAGWKGEFLVAVFGEPLKAWTKGSEVRKGRTRQFSVFNPTVSYIKKLKAKLTP